MFSRALTLAAAAGVGASAFLLPPGVNSMNAPDALSNFANPLTQTVKLPCPDCVFSKTEERITEVEEEGDDLFWAQGGARAITVNFTLSEDSRAVNINDWQVYPITMDNSNGPTVAEVAAIETVDTATEGTTLDVSGASIFINEELISPAGDKIVRVNYQVLSLAGQPVTVDAAEVKLLQGADGSLLIISAEGVAQVDAFPGRPPHSPTKGAAKECKHLPAALCKWKNLVETKVGGFKQGLPHKFGGKGCGGRKGPGPHKLPGHLRPPHFDHFDKPNDEDRPKHHEGRPPHPRPEHGMHRGPHHHHHGAHGHHLVHRFIRAFLSVLVPVIAGITMGMFVSLVGMAVGRTIAFLWIKFRRGGQRGYASVAQSDADSESAEKGFVEVNEVAEEPLPEYEAAPAYEEEEEEKK